MFGVSVYQIWSYKRLVHQVERLRSEQYNAENVEHEEKLMELWRHLMPDEPLTERVSKQWQEIGFQVIVMKNFMINYIIIILFYI